MKRNFPNFLEAYFQYAKNDLVPDAYTLWTGLSLLAGALERKVWIQSDPMMTYPNLFVLLVGTPGAGKSQAIRPAKPLLYGLGLSNRDFKIMEGITTQAGLCERMEQFAKAPDGSLYSSIYIIGSEASDSALKNHADDFRSTACAMYDCEHLYEKTLKSKSYSIPNPVMNLIAGSTFDFLGTIVDQNSVMGGLASRFTYVIDEKDLPEDAGLGQSARPANVAMQTQLTEDLVLINKLHGPFKFDRPALILHKEWWSAYRKDFKAVESERMRSLLVRKPMLIKKLMMLFSVAERNDLGVTLEHMERAIKAVDEVTENCSRVISSAMISNRDSQAGINQLILEVLQKSGGKMRIATLKNKIMRQGSEAIRVEPTLKLLAEAQAISFEGAADVRLLIDPRSVL